MSGNLTADGRISQRPRSPDGERRSVMVFFRATPSERAILERAAHTRGISLSDLVRSTMLHYTTGKRGEYVPRAQMGKV